MFRSILAPTDGSEHAAHAVDAAIDLALKYQAQLVILHVEIHHGSAQEIRHILREGDIPADMQREIEMLQSVTAPIPVGGIRGKRTLSHKLESYVADFIIRRARKKAEDAGLTDVTSHIASGSPSKRISELAEQENIELLVMGTRGLGGLESVLQGSVSQAVRHHCHCACLTLP
jgi:nucleotide-binding universal stress UspA family protein